MTDAPSVTTVVVGDRLPWPDEASHADARGPYDSGAIIVAGSRQPCSIRKISAIGATVSSDLTPGIGESVWVELESGQRASGKVAWATRREIGVRFDDPIDVIALLNRKLVSQTPERRTMPRVEVRCPVHVKSGEHFWTVTLRNISARGLQIEGDELPAAGAYVAIFAEGLNIPPGEVAWKRERIAGIEVLEELSWTSIIPWVRGLVKRETN